MDILIERMWTYVCGGIIGSYIGGWLKAIYTHGDFITIFLKIDTVVHY